MPFRTPSLLALLAAGCGQGSGAAPEVVRLLEQADVRYVAGTGLPRRAAAEPVGPWRPVVRTERAPTAAERESFRASSHAGSHEIVVGPPGGSWLRVFAVAPGARLLLRVRAEVEGPPRPPGTVLASVHALELQSAAHADSATAAARSLATHRELLRAPATELDLTLPLAVGEETRVVAVVLGASVEAPGSRCRFTDVELVDPGFGDLVADVAETRPGGLPRSHAAPRETLPRGSFRLGTVSRRAAALGAGASVTFRVRAPRRAARVECVVGLVPHVLGRGTARVRFVCEILDRTGASRARSERVLRARAASDRRWTGLAVDVPAVLRGERVDVRLRTESVRGGRYSVPLVARPRLVPESPRRVGPNVVLVSIDTLRADHVGAYGYARDTTPRLDELAAESLVFTDTWAQCSYTLPSHMSLLSGQFPSFHGVHGPDDALDPRSTVLLAEVLRAEGYATAAFTGGGFVLPEFGFARGFERYGTLDLVLNDGSRRVREFFEAVPALSRDLLAELTPGAVEDWIARHREESFFLFFHTYAAHDYDPSAEHRRALGIEGGGLSGDERLQRWLGPPDQWPERPMPRADRERLTDLYDAGTRAADEAVGRILDALRREGLREETLVVVTSDHGEELGDRGGAGHGHTLFEEQLRVPLIVRVPGVARARIDEPAMLVDVVPTVLDALGLDAPRAVQGTSLLDLPPERSLFAEVDYLARKAALREGRLKTIYSPLGAARAWPNEREEATFDLAVDPGELRPLPRSAERLRRVQHFLEELRALRGDRGGGAAPDLGEDALRQLEALGYGVR